MAANRKQYLGDSVYAEFDGFGVTLTTENGNGPSNTIYMEPDVLSALSLFTNDIGKGVEVDSVKQEYPPGWEF